MKPRGAFAALILMLTFVTGLLVAGGSVQAAEEKSAPVPAVSTVNINTADAQTLAAKLKGVGEARANDIVRYREAYGPFSSAEELTEVKGIGKSTLEANREAITLE